MDGEMEGDQQCHNALNVSICHFVNLYIQRLTFQQIC